MLLTALLLSPAADVPSAAAGVPAVAILFACVIVSALAIIKINVIFVSVTDPYSFDPAFWAEYQSDPDLIRI